MVKMSTYLGYFEVNSPKQQLSHFWGTAAPDFFTSLLYFTIFDFFLGMHVEVPGMCRNSLYVVDFLILPSDLMIYASVAESMLKLGKLATKNQHLTAVLVHTPEHYEQSQTHLLGHQAMRARQLKKLGYKVMHVNYSEVNKLIVVPSRLNEYLQKKYDEALKS